MTSETYPSTPITFGRVFPYLVIIILAILLFRSCGKVVPKPVVITGEQVHDTITLVDNERQRLSDSFNLISSRQQREIDKYKIKYEDLVTLYLNEQNDIAFVLTKKIPDTCKPIVAELTGKFNSLKATSAEKDKAASNTINALTTQNRTKDKFLASKDSSFKRLKNVCDTCALALAAMEKYSKKLQPKRTIYISAIALGNKNKYLNGYGIGVGLTNKKGTSFEVGAIQINKVINYSVSIKRPLLKF